MRYNQEGEIGPWFTKAHPRNLEVLALRRRIGGQVLPFLNDKSLYLLISPPLALMNSGG